MIHSELVKNDHMNGVEVQMEGDEETLMSELQGIIEAFLHTSDLEFKALDCMVQVTEEHIRGDSDD